MGGRARHWRLYLVGAYLGYSLLTELRNYYRMKSDETLCVFLGSSCFQLGNNALTVIIPFYLELTVQITSQWPANPGQKNVPAWDGVKFRYSHFIENNRFTREIKNGQKNISSVPQQAEAHRGEPRRGGSRACGRGREGRAPGESRRRRTSRTHRPPGRARRVGARDDRVFEKVDQRTQD